MTTMTKHAAGTFCWTQLATPDVEGAKKFYAGLFGWKPEDSEVEGRRFTIVRKQDKAIGAIMNQQPGVAPSWTSFVAVDDTDPITARVRQAGGHVLMEPFDVAKNGRMGVFEDPTRGAFAVWQAGTRTGAEVMHEPGAMIWNELITDDANRAGAFYEQVFGWTREKSTGLQGMPYTMFKRGKDGIGGMIQATPEMKLTHPYWMVYFAIDGTDKAANRVPQLGGKIQMQPVDIPMVGRIAAITDPQGAWFSVIKPNPNM